VMFINRSCQLVPNQGFVWDSVPWKLPSLNNIEDRLLNKRTYPIGHLVMYADIRMTLVCRLFLRGVLALAQVQC
jgi:hypothetical protein